MYLCVCKGITEEQVESLQINGRTLEEAAKILGVGSDCGICLLTCQKLSSQTRSKQNDVSKSTAQTTLRILK
jgi:bacterioferritin-associated ferredoxin